MMHWEAATIMYNSEEEKIEMTQRLFSNNFSKNIQEKLQDPLKKNIQRKEENKITAFMPRRCPENANLVFEYCISRICREVPIIPGKMMEAHYLGSDLEIERMNMQEIKGYPYYATGTFDYLVRKTVAKCMVQITRINKDGRNYNFFCFGCVPVQQREYKHHIVGSSKGSCALWGTKRFFHLGTNYTYARNRFQDGRWGKGIRVGDIVSAEIDLRSADPVERTMKFVVGDGNGDVVFPGYFTGLPEELYFALTLSESATTFLSIEETLEPTVVLPAGAKAVKMIS